MIQIAPNMVTEDLPHPCEVPGCTNAPIGDQAYSFRVYMPCPGPGIAGFMLCQHWGCSPQHAYDLLQACIHQHALAELAHQHEAAGLPPVEMKTLV